MTSEAELQRFIADNPWLLNPSYEAIPQLEKNGLEYQAGDKKRIDLILRDKVHKVPVVVEFKFTPFSRENIGQILEYKARVTMTFRKEENQLHDIFGDFVLAPRLILVVKDCDKFSRIACNLAGIDVFVFKDISERFSDEKSVRRIKEFTQALREDPYPLSFDRPQQIAKWIYEPIKAVLEEHRCSWAWPEPRGTSGYYHPAYLNMFVNRWLFEGQPVSIGLKESIIEDDKICIEYFSSNEETMKAFSAAYANEFEAGVTYEWDSEWSEGTLTRRFSRPEFFQNAGAFFKEELRRYLQLKSLTLSLERRP